MSSIANSISWNDAVLAASLLYSCVDICCVWADFGGCQQPIHHWLLVTYLSILGFRLLHVAFGVLTNAQSSNLRQAHRGKSMLPRALAGFIWLVAVPLFCVWTLLGTLRLHSVMKATPHCMPLFYGWLCCFWFLVSYLWIVVQLASGVKIWQMEARVHRAARNVRAIETDDTRNRWGDIANHDGACAGMGLAPKEILALPESRHCCAPGEASDDNVECPICLCEFKENDSVRRLPICQHSFHRSCIDLWLLRRAECPLCKCHVRGTSMGNV